MKQIVCGMWCVALFVAFSTYPVSAQKVGMTEGEIEAYDATSTAFNKTTPSTFSFLKVAQSARVAGMGDAFTAVADGIEGIYYNPASIASVERVGFTFGYSQWLVSSEFYSGAIAINLSSGFVGGISFINYKIPEVEETTTLKPLGTGRMLELGDLAVGFHIARRMTDKLQVGGMFRYVQSKLDHAELTGISVSFGTLLHTGFRSLRIGMSMKNMGNQQLVVSERAAIPILFNVGSSMEIVGELGDPLSVTASFEGAYFTDTEQRWNVGAELWLNSMLAVRAGKKFGYDTDDWSVGAGLKGTFDGRRIALDMSYSEMGTDFAKPIRVTFSGMF